MSQYLKGCMALSGIVSAMMVFVNEPAFATNYGDDSSQYANDGECDDLRFVGPGMEGITLINDDVLADATDCRQMVREGTIWYFGDDQLDFGDDGGEWSRDNECDDPRFTGPGMTDTPLLAEDIKKDASDCRRAYEDGTIWMR